MSALPDPSVSRAVLIGVSRYTALEPLPGVANNLPALATALTGPVSWSLPAEHCAVVAEPATHREMLDPVREAAEAASDTVLVYFSGHGLVDSRGSLFFGLPGSVAGQGYTGVSYELLRDVLAHGRAERYVIILDCCFSGRALGLMGASQALADQTEIDGSYLLAAAPENSSALAPLGETYTAFTGELLHVLTCGIDGGPRELDLESVYRYLQSVLQAKGRPVPQKRDRNTAGRLVLARNPAFRPAPALSDPGNLRWPDPAGFHTPRGFLAALEEVRGVSGKTIRTIGEEADPPLSPGTVSRLLKRTTLPKTWKTTGIYLAACGLDPQQRDAWQTAWERLRAPEQGQLAAVAAPAQTAARASRARERLRLSFDAGCGVGWKLSMLPLTSSSEPAESIDDFLGTLQALGFAESETEPFREITRKLPEAESNEAARSLIRAYSAAMSNVVDLMSSRSSPEEFRCFSLGRLLYSIAHVMMFSWPEDPGEDLKSLRDELFFLSNCLNAPDKFRAELKDYSTMPFASADRLDALDRANHLRNICYTVLF